VNGYESTDQVRGFVPVPPMEMKGNGTVLEHATTPSASEEQPGPVSTSRQFAGRSRWSRCWTRSASSPRNDRGCSGREAVRCTPPRRAIAARWRWAAPLAMGAAVTATRLSSGRQPRSGRCTRRRSIFVIGSAATFPGFGVGDDPFDHRAAAPRETSSPNETEQRRGHRYSSRGSDPIDGL
jgi:hypothetical protein